MRSEMRPSGGSSPLSGSEGGDGGRGPRWQDVDMEDEEPIEEPRYRNGLGKRGLGKDPQGKCKHMLIWN